MGPKIGIAHRKTKFQPRSLTLWVIKAERSSKLKGSGVSNVRTFFFFFFYSACDREAEHEPLDFHHHEAVNSTCASLFYQHAHNAPTHFHLV